MPTPRGAANGWDHVRHGKRPYRPEETSPIAPRRRSANGPALVLCHHDGLRRARHVPACGPSSLFGWRTIVQLRRTGDSGLPSPRRARTRRSGGRKIGFVVAIARRLGGADRGRRRSRRCRRVRLPSAPRRGIGGRPRRRRTHARRTVGDGRVVADRRRSARADHARDRRSVRPGPQPDLHGHAGHRHRTGDDDPQPGEHRRAGRARGRPSRSRSASWKSRTSRPCTATDTSTYARRVGRFMPGLGRLA